MSFSSRIAILAAFACLLSGAPCFGAKPPVSKAPAASTAQTPLAQKVIKDPAEYNAYMAAFNTADPAAKAAAMQAFVAQYPASVVKTDALEQAMAAYQQAGDAAKVEDTAKQILGLDAGNIRALAILTFLSRSHADQGDAQALAQTAAYAKRGLEQLPKWQKPADLSA